MARPTKQPRERRDKMIGVKVTGEEYELLRRLAFDAHKSVGAFVRDRALTGKPTATTRKGG